MIIIIIQSYYKNTYLLKNKIKGICFTERSFIDEIEYDLENALEIYLQFFID